MVGRTCTRFNIIPCWLRPQIHSQMQFPSKELLWCPYMTLNKIFTAKKRTHVDTKITCYLSRQTSFAFHSWPVTLSVLIYNYTTTATTLAFKPAQTSDTCIYKYLLSVSIFATNRITYLCCHSKWLPSLSHIFWKCRRHKQARMYAR